MKNDIRQLKVDVQLDGAKLNIGDSVTIVYPPGRIVLCHGTGWYEIGETYLEELTPLNSERGKI